MKFIIQYALQGDNGTHAKQNPQKGIFHINFKLKNLL